MRILFLFDGVGRGGRERRFVQLVKGLNHAGYNDLYLINTRDLLEYSELQDYNITIEYLNRHQVMFLSRLIKRIRYINPDVVQPWIDIDAFYMNIAYYFLPKNVVYISSFIADCNYHKHALWSKLTMAWAYRLSRHIISNSIAGFENYRVPQTKRLCIYNGFDFERLKYRSHTSIRKEMHINTPYIVAMIARMQDNKDFPMYIRAASNILKHRVDVTFLAIGSGPLENEWRKTVPNELKHQIIFTGRRDDIDSILQEVDISVLCTNSDKHGEGVSNSILESMASGVPVVATLGGGTSEIVVDGETGFLVQPKDDATLAEKLCLLLDNNILHRNLSRNSVERIKKFFSLEVSTRKYVEMYSSLHCD